MMLRERRISGIECKFGFCRMHLTELEENPSSKLRLKSVSVGTPHVTKLKNES